MEAWSLEKDQEMWKLDHVKQFVFYFISSGTENSQLALDWSGKGGFQEINCDFVLQKVFVAEITVAPGLLGLKPNRQHRVVSFGFQ